MTELEEQSIQSIIAESSLRILNIKETFTDEKKVARLIAQRSVKNEKPIRYPAKTLKSAVTKETVQGMDVFYLAGMEPADKQILYLHGGAYINQPLWRHWTFLDEIVMETNAMIVFPIYPKAPNHTYREAFQKVLAVYENLLAGTNPGNITIMGDSAGGGFSLALCQLLLEKGIAQPGNIILISPWLDITMSNPEIPSMEDTDPILSAYGLIQVGKAWAGDSDPNHYLLSPINGPIQGLGRISLFVGTHELFLPDSRKLRALAQAQGVTLQYYEYPNMNHAFSLYPIPEAREATCRILEIINGNRV